MTIAAGSGLSFMLWYISSCAALIVSVVDALCFRFDHFVDGVIRTNPSHTLWSPLKKDFRNALGSAQRGKAIFITGEIRSEKRTSVLRQSELSGVQVC